MLIFGVLNVLDLQVCEEVLRLIELDPVRSLLFLLLLLHLRLGSRLLLFIVQVNPEYRFLLNIVNHLPTTPSQIATIAAPLH